MAVPVFTAGQVLVAADVNVWFLPISAIKTSNESVTSSTALQNDDALFLSLASNSTYEVTGLLSTDGAAAGDIKVTFTGPAGASICMYFNALSVSAVGGGDDLVFILESFGTTGSFGTIAAADHRAIAFRGQVTIAGTAGNLQLQWAQDTSSGTATRVLAGSYISARRIS